MSGSNKKRLSSSSTKPKRPSPPSSPRKDDSSEGSSTGAIPTITKSRRRSRERTATPTATSAGEAISLDPIEASSTTTRPPARPDSAELSKKKRASKPATSSPETYDPIKLDVAYIKQDTRWGCWLAALRMLMKHHKGSDFEPVGHPKAVAEGQKVEERLQGLLAGVTDRQGRRTIIGKNNPRGLAPGEFGELAAYNGLVIAEPSDSSGQWTVGQLRDLVAVHGPLWCALDVMHVVIVKGIAADGHILVDDPQKRPDMEFEIDGFNKMIYRVLYFPAGSKD